ncbi:MAG: hypothetical protein ACRD2A_07085 [Vicinamibacterales bacterium]
MPPESAERHPEGRWLLVDGRPTFVPSTLTEVGRAKFPGGPPELPPAQPSAQRRGRPRTNRPTGIWVDSDHLARRVAAIVGDRDERNGDRRDGADVYDGLCRLARRLLGQPLTPTHRDRLRRLARTAKASVIIRQLVAWRHGLTDRDVRRMTNALHVKDGDVDDSGQPKKPRPRVKLVYR